MRRSRYGFTLVELLVVITIIGILVALLLPAVQAAREAGRRAQCSNNIKQLSLACLEHLEAQGHFPTGGWGYTWVGLPDCGYGSKQPAGWIYNVLPFMEQQGLHDLGQGGDVKAGSAQRISTPLPFLNCPTRRRAVAYPCTNNWSHSKNPQMTNTVSQVARADYAINGGSVVIMHGPGPSSLTDSSYGWPDNSKGDGIAYLRSQVTSGDITDGESNTYLLGEKYLNPDDYATGLDGGDNETAYSGDEQDLIRWGKNDSSHVPYQDRSGVSLVQTFGSAHPAGWIAALSDGSVRLFSFRIDPVTHQYLACRSDGQVIDQTKMEQ